MFPIKLINSFLVLFFLSNPASNLIPSSKPSLLTRAQGHTPCKVVRMLLATSHSGEDRCPWQPRTVARPLTTASHGDKDAHLRLCGCTRQLLGRVSRCLLRPCEAVVWLCE